MSRFRSSAEVMTLATSQNYKSQDYIYNFPSSCVLWLHLLLLKAASTISPAGFMFSNGTRISRTDKDGMKFIPLMLKNLHWDDICYNLQIALSPTYAKKRTGLHADYKYNLGIALWPTYAKQTTGLYVHYNTYNTYYATKNTITTTLQVTAFSF